MKFKVGDKVRVLDDKSILFGKECVVTIAGGNSDYPYKVEFDEGYSIYKEEDLELIEEPKEEVKPIKTNRLEEITTALNILGSLGIELDVKIYAEINGKVVVL